jgi:regulator of protease activity HflC (stomatin/prohibitin superfamily)
MTGIAGHDAMTGIAGHGAMTGIAGHGAAPGIAGHGAAPGIAGPGATTGIAGPDAVTGEAGPGAAGREAGLGATRRDSRPGATGPDPDPATTPTAAGHRPPAAEPNGPLVQSLRIALRVLYGVTVLLALGWLASGIVRVPADGTAVTLRFGRIVRVQGAGLALAWPPPVEQTVLLPGPARQLTLAITGAPHPAGLDPVARLVSRGPLLGGAGSLLTGDGGVVLLDASLAYRITDPAAYYLTESHVVPALQRCFAASAVAVAAGHDLDDFLVARPGRLAAGAVAALRAAVHAELLAGVNRRLAGLGLGIEVTRLDVTAALPPVAKQAFDSVLTAGQMADQGIAAARTDAERTAQQAARDRDRILDQAQAAAAERVSDARTKVAAVVALEAQETPATRDALLQRAFRDAAAVLLARAGTVTTVDPRGGARLILPGAPPAASPGAGSP